MQAVFLPQAAESVYLWLHDVPTSPEAFTPGVAFRLSGGERVRPPRSGGCDRANACRTDLNLV
eukprot:66694-Amphidinium_carterae.1